MKKLPVTAIAAATITSLLVLEVFAALLTASATTSASEIDEDAQLLAYDTILLEGLSTWENSFT
jgi:hypothetical protein